MTLIALYVHYSYLLNIILLKKFLLNLGGRGGNQTKKPHFCFRKKFLPWASKNKEKSFGVGSKRVRLSPCWTYLVLASARKRPLDGINLSQLSGSRLDTFRSLTITMHLPNFPPTALLQTLLKWLDESLSPAWLTAVIREHFRHVGFSRKTLTSLILTVPYAVNTSF